MMPVTEPLDPLAVYVHLPFCTQKCDYCAFNSGPVDAAIRTAYLARIPREFERFHTRFPHYPRQAHSIFLGGGTPSVLTPDEMDQLLRQLLNFFPCPIEFTCEVNPQTASRPLFEVLQAHGCNRISMGLQTFDAGLLAQYGRAHGVAEFYETYEVVRALGFPQISFDLLYGHPDQTLAMWEADLTQALALAPSHVSLYALKVEPNTPFARADLEARQDPDRMADMFDLARDRMAAAGLQRYELSNFAQSGHQSLHNRAYWEFRDWVGFGLEAHSLLRTAPDLPPQPWVREKTYSRYFEALDAGNDALVPADSWTPEEVWQTALLMGLRLAEGVHVQTFDARWGTSLVDQIAPRLRQQEAWGLVEWGTDTGGELRLRLTEKGVYLSNQVFEALV